MTIIISFFINIKIGNNGIIKGNYYNYSNL